MPTILIMMFAVFMKILKMHKGKVFGFQKIPRPIKMISQMFFLAAIWTLVDTGLLIPLFNHITGTMQNLNMYEDLRGNLELLMFMLCASWTLAALGEEMVYRGYLQTIINTIFRDDSLGRVVAIGISSVLFGMAHLEQGIVGVAVTIVDAIFFSFVRYKYNNLWASVLVHGFLNSIGVITFYFCGPVYSLW
jgi:membrane protease YdiL (CAAX protease family)